MEGHLSLKHGLQSCLTMPVIPHIHTYRAFHVTPSSAVFECQQQIGLRMGSGQMNMRSQVLRGWFFDGIGGAARDLSQTKDKPNNNGIGIS